MAETISIIPLNGSPQTKYTANHYKFFDPDLNKLDTVGILLDYGANITTVVLEGNWFFLGFVQLDFDRSFLSEKRNFSSLAFFAGILSLLAYMEKLFPESQIWKDQHFICGMLVLTIAVCVGFQVPYISS